MADAHQYKSRQQRVLWALCLQEIYSIGLHTAFSHYLSSPLVCWNWWLIIIIISARSQQLESSLLIEELKWATKTRDVRVCKSDPKILPSFLAIFLSDLTLPFSYSQSDNNKADVGVPGLWHFVYYSTAAIQITCPTFEPPYNTDKQKKRFCADHLSLSSPLYHLSHRSHVFYRLFRLYQHLQSKVNGRLSRKVFFRQTNHENMLAWTTGGFQLWVSPPSSSFEEGFFFCSIFSRSLVHALSLLALLYFSSDLRFLPFWG